MIPGGSPVGKRKCKKHGGTPHDFQVGTPRAPIRSDKARRFACAKDFDVQGTLKGFYHVGCGTHQDASLIPLAGNDVLPTWHKGRANGPPCAVLAFIPAFTQQRSSQGLVKSFFVKNHRFLRMPTAKIVTAWHLLMVVCGS